MIVWSAGGDGGSVGNARYVSVDGFLLVRDADVEGCGRGSRRGEGGRKAVVGLGELWWERERGNGRYGERKWERGREVMGFVKENRGWVVDDGFGDSVM